MGDGQWRLYNLARDPGETTDLSASEPAVKARLLAEYDAYAKRVGVLPMPEGYDSRAEVSRNIGARLLSNFPWLYGALAGILLVTVAAIWLGVRQMRRLLRRRRAA
jgi:protein-S-isoprenylcysteine O-methyltransferase Ste14